MRAVVIVLLAALAVGLAASAGGQTAIVPSGSYTDFQQLLSGGPPTAQVNIAMTLRFPDRQQDRHPAIVIVHTIAGYQELNEGWHANEFRKAGFATLTFTSPAAGRLLAGDGIGGWPSAVAEAYAALRFLADNPRIDADRIAIVGFSFGGEVAHLAAMERLRAGIASDRQRFAAHVAYYPAGVHGAMAERGAYTGAPILMLLGDEDDNLPIAKVQGYLAYAQSAGAPPPVDVSIYRGAYHAWTVSSLGPPTFYPQYRSMRKCPYLLVGAAAPAMLVDGRERPIEPDAVQACRTQGQGYSMAYDESMRAASTRDVVAFLSRILKP